MAKLMEEGDPFDVNIIEQTEEYVFTNTLATISPFMKWKRMTNNIDAILLGQVEKTLRNVQNFLRSHTLASVTQKNRTITELFHDHQLLLYGAGNDAAAL